MISGASAMTYGLAASAIKWSTGKDSEAGLEGVGVSNAELRRKKSTTRYSRYRYRIGVDIVGAECCCRHAGCGKADQPYASQQAGHGRYVTEVFSKQLRTAMSLDLQAKSFGPGRVKT